MPRMSPGVLVDHGSDWIPFIVLPPGEDAEEYSARVMAPMLTPGRSVAPVIEIGRRSLRVRLIAWLRSLAR